MNLWAWLNCNYFLLDHFNSFLLKILFLLLFFKLFELQSIHDLGWLNKLSWEFLIFVFILSRNCLLLHTWSIFKRIGSLNLILRLNFYRLLDCDDFLLDYIDTLFLKIRIFFFFLKLFEFLCVHNISWFNKLPGKFLISVFVISSNSSLFFGISILSWTFLRLSLIKW